MSTSEPRFTHVVLWMTANAWPLQSQVVAADEVIHEVNRLTFRQDGRVIFQTRPGDVTHIESHTSLKAAQHAFEERRAIRGRGGLRIEELAPPAGGTRSNDTRTRGGPAECIGFRVSEDR